HSAAGDYVAFIHPDGGGEHGAPQPGTEASPGGAGQEHGGDHATSSGDYMALVQNQDGGNHGAAGAHTTPNHGSGGADYAHMGGDASPQGGAGAQPPQEPPPADHLFADAHVDQGAHDPSGGAHPGADAPPVDATPPPEPPPEHHDQG